MPSTQVPFVCVICKGSKHSQIYIQTNNLKVNVLFLSDSSKILYINWLCPACTNLVNFKNILDLFVKPAIFL